MSNITIDRLNELFTETLPFILDDKQYTLVKALPRKQRICFLLRNAYGYSYKQISETINISLTAVKQNLHKAQNKVTK